MNDEEFINLVNKGIYHCNRGDVFQIVLSRKFFQKFKGDEFAAYRKLRSVNPSPYLFYFDFGDFKIFGSSPEAQLIVNNNKAEIHPIAGTFKRTGNDDYDRDKALELSKDDKLTYHFPREKFIESVGVAKEYISNGDVMQVVLSQRISIEFNECPIEFYRELRKLNPSPYMYYLNFGDFHIIGSSPEILVRLENDTITVRPIAGTRPRGKNEVDDTKLEKDLLNDPKEIAEHLMLIDLGRNDVGRVSEIGSVRLTDKMIIEKYSHVMHMVSNVTGKVLKTAGIIDVLKASFPAGTVSGAPKIRATEIIYELEPLKRGIYAGAIGYLGWNGNMDTAIAIRTCVIKDNKLNIQCGAGIVYDSVPELEWEETINKGKAIIQAYNNTRNRQK